MYYPVAVFLCFMLLGHLISDRQCQIQLFLPPGPHILPSSTLFRSSFQWNISRGILLVYSSSILVSLIKQQKYMYKRTFYKLIPFKIFFLLNWTLQELTFSVQTDLRRWKNAGIHILTSERKSFYQPRKQARPQTMASITHNFFCKHQSINRTEVHKGIQLANGLKATSASPYSPA